MPLSKEQIILGVLRISLGTIFFWAFIDKLFGLGIATKKEAAWFAGGSPTTGFLANATKGPFKAIFASLSGQAWVDWLFMIGLMAIGLCLIVGIGMRIAVISGSLMLLLMYLALIPPQNHPFLDEHLIYILVLWVLLFFNAHKSIGLGELWANTKIVKKFPVLE